MSFKRKFKRKREQLLKEGNYLDLADLAELDDEIIIEGTIRRGNKIIIEDDLMSIIYGFCYSPKLEKKQSLITRLYKEGEKEILLNLSKDYEEETEEETEEVISDKDAIGMEIEIKEGFFYSHNIDIDIDFPEFCNFEDFKDLVDSKIKETENRLSIYLTSMFKEDLKIELV